MLLSLVLQWIQYAYSQKVLTPQQNPATPPGNLQSPSTKVAPNAGQKAGEGGGNIAVKPQPNVVKLPLVQKNQPGQIPIRKLPPKVPPVTDQVRWMQVERERRRQQERQQLLVSSSSSSSSSPNQQIPKQNIPHQQHKPTLHSQDLMKEPSRDCYKPVPVDAGVPVFFINLDRSERRRKYTQNQLSKMRLKYSRIRAWQDGDMKNVTIHVAPVMVNTEKEMGCLVSHLVAIHTAVHDDKISPSSPYAIIMEDDVRFEMDVNFVIMASNAPKDFGILQLMMSNSYELNFMWPDYKNHTNYLYESKKKTVPTPLQHDFRLDIDSTSKAMWKYRDWVAPLWSTQAYMINKARAKPIIDKLVHVDPKTGAIKITILNPSEKLFPCPTKVHCPIPFRLVADMYLFTAFGPTYTSSIPLMNGAKVGQNSTIHNKIKKDEAHQRDFIKIHSLLNDAQNHSHLLPPFIKPKACLQTV